jgi:hypothetical protein
LSNATWADANKKLDEIIAYCKKKPNAGNDYIGSEAQILQNNPGFVALESSWAAQGMTVIAGINGWIAALT